MAEDARKRLREQGRITRGKILIGLIALAVIIFASVMIEKNINRVPIINDDGQLLGIVTRHDIVRAAYLEAHNQDETSGVSQEQEHE